MKKVTSLFQKHPYLITLVSALFTVVIILAVFALLRFAPFGDNAITVGDGAIQYRDFFLYLRRVLLGEDSLLFTFTKGLGGSAIALYAYYLASPLNILVLLFGAGQTDLFLAVLFVIKVALAAATFSIFLIWRWKDKFQENPCKLIFVVLLALGYSLSQYLVAQSSNTMWLDGVYMLPLMMLAVTRLVRQNRAVLLSVVTGLAILFNWYSGGMNCVFLIFWFVFELANHWQGRSLNWLQIWRTCGKFVLALLIAVMISGVLFLPSVVAILSTSHGSLAWGSLIKPLFVGSPLAVVDRYTIGIRSEIGYPSLYCGSLAIIGVVMLFISPRVKSAQKAIYGGLLVVLLLSCFCQPLMTLFSLLETVYSYWYRYAYLIIAALLTLSGTYFVVFARKQDYRQIWKVGAAIAAVILAANYFSPNLERDNWYYTRAWFTAALFVVVAFVAGKVIKKLLVANTVKPRSYNWWLLTLIGMVLAESALEVGSFVRVFREARLSEAEVYAVETRGLLDGVQAKDDSVYRISQTTTRFTDAENRTANYNEALAFGYYGLATYTSTVDDAQINLLDRLGYRADYEIKNIVNTSVIGADSLLGVKYIMSPFAINGLVKTDIASATSDKAVYENPYALPMALVFSDNRLQVKYEDRNPFVYQNEIYSKLLGRKVELYKPLKYQLVQAGDVAARQSQQYQVEIPAGNYAVYGQIFTTNNNWDMMLDVDGVYRTAYARDILPTDGSLSPSVFYIPSNGKASRALVTLTSNQSYNLESGTEQFYALDLDLLGKVVAEIKQNSPAVELTLDGTRVQAKVDAAELGQYLYLAITEDAGWRIYRNGEEIKPELLADALYVLPLVEGENQIELRYRVCGLVSGAVVSGLGVISVLGFAWCEKKQRRQAPVGQQLMAASLLGVAEKLPPEDE